MSEIISPLPFIDGNFSPLSLARQINCIAARRGKDLGQAAAVRVLALRLAGVAAPPGGAGEGERGIGPPGLHPGAAPGHGIGIDHHQSLIPVLHHAEALLPLLDALHDPGGIVFDRVVAKAVVARKNSEVPAPSAPPERGIAGNDKKLFKQRFYSK